MPTQEQIEIVAECEAKFDGREWLAMPRWNRERYANRVKLAFQELERVDETKMSLNGLKTPVKIDKDIPMPQPHPYSGGRVKYPWILLEVGDSFLITVNSRQSAHSMARRASAALGKKFKARDTEDGWRVWRVE